MSCAAGKQRKLVNKDTILSTEDVTAVREGITSIEHDLKGAGISNLM